MPDVDPTGIVIGLLPTLTLLPRVIEFEKGAMGILTAVCRVPFQGIMTMINTMQFEHGKSNRRDCQVSSTCGDLRAFVTCVCSYCLTFM